MIFIASAPFFLFSFVSALFSSLSLSLLLKISLCFSFILFPNTVEYDKQHFNQLQATEKQKHKQDLEQVSIQRVSHWMHGTHLILRFVIYTRAGIIVIGI